MSFVWNWPQIVWAVLMGIGIVMHAALNGEAMNAKWNFPLKLCAVAFTAFVLYCGGFWAGVSP